MVCIMNLYFVFTVQIIEFTWKKCTRELNFRHNFFTVFLDMQKITWVEDYGHSELSLSKEIVPNF